MEIVHKCPLCDNEIKIPPIEASGMCELCGMSMSGESDRYMIVHDFSYHVFCSAKCLKNYHALHDLTIAKTQVDGGRDGS